MMETSVQTVDILSRSRKLTPVNAPLLVVHCEPVLGPKACALMSWTRRKNTKSAFPRIFTMLTSNQLYK